MPSAKAAAKAKAAGFFLAFGQGMVI